MKKNIFKLLLLFLAIQLNADILRENYVTLDLNTTNPKALIDFESDNLEKFINLDSSGNGIVSWKELYQAKDKIIPLVLKNIKIFSDNHECIKKVETFKVYRRVHQSYIKLFLDLKCKKPKHSMSVKYKLFFDVDKDQKAFIKIKNSKQKVVMLSKRKQRADFVFKTTSSWKAFKNFFIEGVWHIWMGYDHILFLLMLILSTVYFQKGFKAIMINILKVVTAFSVAHSITLALSATKTISINPQFIEVAIALSVLFTAINNLYPVIKGKLYILAFGFGLIHGFGFANVLRDLLVNAKDFVIMLVGFNLGVETGQIIIVLGVVPVFYLLKEKKIFLYIFSFLTALISFWWAIERAFSL